MNNQQINRQIHIAISIFKKWNILCYQIWQGLFWHLWRSKSIYLIICSIFITAYDCHLSHCSDILHLFVFYMYIYIYIYVFSLYCVSLYLFLFSNQHSAWQRLGAKSIWVNERWTLLNIQSDQNKILINDWVPFACQ